MVQFEELLLKLQALKPEIDDLSDALGMKGMLSEIQQLELKATEPGFWDDVEKSQIVLQRTGSLKGKVEAYENLVAKYEDTHALIELANEEEDESLLEEAESEVEAVKENLEKQGYKVGLIGTIATYIGDKKLEDSDRTTPESNNLQKIFYKMAKEECDVVVMEVSSQSLKLNRVAGCDFDIGVFTNFSEDHISPKEHPDMQDYFNSKLKLLKIHVVFVGAVA